MSYENRNPLNRGYSPAEIAASKRQGVASDEKAVKDWSTMEIEHFVSGPIYFARGDYYPTMARKRANDWLLIADAMDREWGKEMMEQAIEQQSMNTALPYPSDGQHYEGCPCGTCQDIRAARTVNIPLAYWACCGATLVVTFSAGRYIGAGDHHPHCKEK